MSDEEKREERAAEQADKLVNAVERILDSNEAIIAEVERAKAKVAKGGRVTDDEEALLAAAKLLVATYSNRAALAGGASALPALVPGAGTLLSVLGGTLADMALTLKLEVEMALALSHLMGFDIRNRADRQFAFLLASVGAYDAHTGKDVLRDVLNITSTAVWNYSPRQVSKIIITVVAKLILAMSARGLIKALPLVGVIVGGSVNKLMSTKVGNHCIGELLARRRTVGRDGVEEPAVDADFHPVDEAGAPPPPAEESPAPAAEATPDAEESPADPAPAPGAAAPSEASGSEEESPDETH